LQAGRHARRRAGCAQKSAYFRDRASGDDFRTPAKMLVACDDRTRVEVHGGEARAFARAACDCAAIADARRRVVSDKDDGRA
jgi:hypothetical protein